ncbi:MAG TPA: hypothetical protein VGN97_17295 [Mesorhizobium sp.]|jgi:nitrile hydratase accessory protein|nr:hypothetical protein [Mesorhizobium sp.]
MLSPPERPSGTLKRRDGEPGFQEPWNAQVLALADLMVRSGKIRQREWTEALGAELAAAGRTGKPDDANAYFEAALAALERLLVTGGGISRDELDARREAWEDAYLHTPHGCPVELGKGDCRKSGVPHD